MSEFTNIVVPYDFSEHSMAALETALRLARRLESNLHLVHVFKPPALTYGYAIGGASAATPAIDMLEIRGAAVSALQLVANQQTDVPTSLDIHVFEAANTSVSICDAAESLKADLIVMGTHGRTGFAHVFLGSVAERTIRTAPCPVVTVKSHEASATA